MWEHLRHRRDGVTVIELLVAIAIVGILAALALPAISSSRELARRMKCTNNLRNVALATLNYEQQNQVFPAGTAHYGSYAVPKSGQKDPDSPDNNVLDSHHKIGSWHIALLSFLEERSAFLRWTDDRYPLFYLAPNKPPRSTTFIDARLPKIGSIVCPSASIEQAIIRGRHATSHYIANAGCYSGDQHRPAKKLDGTKLDFAASMTTANGVFFNRYDREHYRSRKTDTGPQTRIRDLVDGTSNTLMYSENVNSRPLGYLRHRPTPPPLPKAIRMDPFDSYFAKEQHYVFGFVWHHVDPTLTGGSATVPLPFRINGERDIPQKWDYPPEQINRVHWTAAFARPSSNHAGGVNMSFCDGTTKFIADSLDYRVYQALMTPHGRKSDVPFPEFRPKPLD